MNFLRHFLIFSCVVIAFATLGHFLPKALSVDPGSLTIGAKPESTKVKTVIFTSKLFEDSLAKSLPTLKRTKLPKNPNEIWTVGKGVALPVYLLRAQKNIRSMGGQVVRMEELNTPQPSAHLTWRDSLGSTTTIELRTGEEFLEGNSTLAVGFSLDSSISIAELNALNGLSKPFSLFVRPLDNMHTLLSDIGKLKNVETVAWVGMEPHRYPWVNPGPNSILIHHNEKEIAKIIDEVSRRIPGAVGVASRMGQRAVEHKPLLQALLRATGERHWWFLDLTQSRFSKSSEVCGELKVPCRMSHIMANGADSQKFLTQALSLAGKSGSGIAILPLSEENVAAYQALLPVAEAQGTIIVKLSSLMNQSE